MIGRFFKFFAFACLVLTGCAQKPEEPKQPTDQTSFRTYKTRELTTQHAYMPYSFVDDKDSRYAFNQADLMRPSKPVEVDNFINISDSSVVIGDAGNKASRTFKIVESFLEKEAGTVDSCYRLVDAQGVECLFCHSMSAKNETYFNFRFAKTAESYKGLKLD